MKRPANVPAEVENRNHTYVTNRIPWFVHVMWITYWLLAISYVLTYQLAAIREAFLSPPP
jgi:hypothetical protein